MLVVFSIMLLLLSMWVALQHLGVIKHLLVIPKENYRFIKDIFSWAIALDNLLQPSKPGASLWTCAWPPLNIHQILVWKWHPLFCWHSHLPLQTTSHTTADMPIWCPPPSLHVSIFFLIISVHFADICLLLTSSLCVLPRRCYEPRLSSSLGVKLFLSWIIQLKMSIYTIAIPFALVVSNSLHYLFKWFSPPFISSSSPSFSKSHH